MDDQDMVDSTASPPRNPTSPLRMRRILIYRADNSKGMGSIARSIIDRRGLTLVETLLILFLIILLVGLLLPAIGHSRESTRRSTCMHNIRQIGLALKQYAIDHDGTFPAGGDTSLKCLMLLTNGAPSTTPPQCYLKAGPVFLCPCDPAGLKRKPYGFGGLSNSYSYVTMDSGGMTGLKETNTADQPLLMDGGLSPTNAFLPSLAGSVSGKPLHGKDGENVYFIGGHVKWVTRLSQDGTNGVTGWVLVPQ